MNCRTRLALGAMALLSLASTAAVAQNAPPTFQADPDVYKVVFEDPNFRVILATWKAGATDKPHDHPVASVGYSLTDCALQLTAADGKTIDLNPKKGTVMTVSITASYSAHNVGSTDCQTPFVERK